MRVIDLGNGQEDYNDEIYDRRGGRGRSRRSDGTYMGYDGGVYDHYGKERDGMMEELERRERDLERRERELERDERELEKRQRHHEREDRCIVRDGLVSATSVMSMIAWILICVEVEEVVTTEEQTPMTRIISGI